MRRLMWILVFVLLAAAEWSLSIKLAPPNDWDEGWFCLVAHAWASFSAAGVRGALWEGFGPAFTGFFEETSGMLYMHTTAKVLAVGLQATSSLAFGGRIAALSLPQALATAGTTMIIGRWALEWAERVGLKAARTFAFTAAAITALSPYLAYFGTTFLAHPIAGFFLTAATWRSWKGGSSRTHVVSGVLFAMAVLSHYSVWPTALVLMSWFLWVGRNDRRMMFRFAAGFIVPFIAVTLISLALAAIVDAKLRPELVWSYPKEVYEQFRSVRDDSRPAVPLYYASRIITIDGWPTLFLLLAGFGLFLRKERGGMGFAVVAFCGLTVFFGTLHFYAARTMVPLLPIGFLAGVAGLWTLTGFLTPKMAPALFATTIFVIIGFRFTFFADLMRYDSPWRAATHLLPTDGTRVFAAVHWPVPACITGRPVEALVRLRTDDHGVFIDDTRPWSDEALSHFLRERSQLIGEVPLVGHATRILWDEDAFGEKPRPDQVIRIYRW